eukprot:scaffold17094_cov121-Isochrysis_galbana.AAC.1
MASMLGMQARLLKVKAVRTMCGASQVRTDAASVPPEHFARGGEVGGNNDGMTRARTRTRRLICHPQHA